MGQRREANVDTSSPFYQERRKAIIQEAAHTFQERGYEATTFGLIAERLQTDRASLYYYFGSKQALFQEVVREGAQQTVEIAEAIAASDAPADKKLQKAFAAVLETYKSSYPFMQVFFQDYFPVVNNPDDDWSRESREWSRRYYMAIRRIVEQGAEEGTFRLTLPVGVATMGILGTVNWAHRWYKPGGSLQPAEIADGFAGMLLNGLKGSAAKRPSNPS